VISGCKNKLVPKKRAEKRAKNDDINSKKCFASKQRKPHQMSKVTFWKSERYEWNVIVLNSSKKKNVIVLKKLMKWYN